MMIEELYIYGYGKFENQYFHLGKTNLQVIYGENEAGKSTIMSFIHSILFGFPTKLQSENRYEPKRGTAYGGYLTLRNEENERLKIERVPGKFGGQVTIELEDGSTKGEEYLQILLSGIDKETYRSIFSFDVHGLQQIQKMNSDQIGKFLFLSSIYGADALFTIEETIMKQQDLIYKPNGKKPSLNEGLLRLKESASQLMDAKRKNSEYEQLLHSKKRLQEKLSLLVSEKKALLSLQRELEKIKSVLPLLNERSWCIDQLKALDHTEHFPEDAIQQLDQHNMTLQPLEVQLHSTVNRKEQLELEKEQLHVNRALIQHKLDIQQAREQFSLYEEKQKNRSILEKKIEQLYHEIDLLKQRLYPHLQDEEILNIKATIPIKETIKKVISMDQQVKHRKQMLDEQFEQARNIVEETEWKINELKKEVLPDEDRADLEKKVAEYNQINSSNLYEEKQQLVTELAKRKKARKQEKKNASMKITFLAIFLVIGSIWLLLQQTWLFLSLFVAACLGLLFQLMSAQAKKDPLLVHLETELSKVEGSLKKVEKSGESSNQPLTELINVLDKDHQVKQSLHHEQLIFQQQERTYERILKQYEEWEENQFQLQRQLSEIADHLQIENDSSSEALLEAFELLQHLQNVILEKNKFLMEEKVVKQDLAHYKENVIELAKSCQIDHSSIEQAVYELFKQCHLESSKDDKLENLKKKQRELEGELTSLRQNIDFLKNQKEDFIKRSGCSNEDEFRKHAKVHQRREELLKQKLWIEKQLATEKELDVTSLSNEKTDDIDLRLQEVEQSIEQCDTKEKELQQEYSRVLINIKDMEQSGTYSNLRHAFENQKAVMKEEAEKWVVRALAKDLLQKTVQRHREEKLPELISSITYFFQKLTSNTYQKVYLPDQKQSFVVERNDGTTFYAEELSQATAEQLYLSIRLALIKNINKQLNLPVIMDDSFVHFDHRRTSNTLRLLNELKNENQVIYFTCHQHIADSYPVKDTINLSDVNVS